MPILAQVYHLPSLFFPMALQPVEWGLWKQRAREFVELHPTVRGVDLTRGERLVTPGARETFAVVTHRREAQVRALGGQPCCRCGCWTACWCEGCSVQPPVALCTERDKADKDHLLCQDRVAQNKLLAEVQHQTAPMDKELVEMATGSSGSTRPLSCPSSRSQSQRTASSTLPASSSSCVLTSSDAAWQEIAKDVQTAVLRTLCDLGVQTCADVAFMWPSAQEFCREVESIMGPEFPSDMAMKLAHVWLRAGRAAQVHTQQLATAVAAERQSSIGQPVKRAVVPAEPPSTSVPGKVRRLLPTGLPVEGLVMVTLAAEADPWAREDALKASKLDQLFRMVLEDVVDLTELGLSWAQLEDPGCMQSFKETLMAAASRLSGARLGALISAFRRWRKSCTEKTYDVRRPTPIQLGEFLRMVASGGPTAAASMHASLKWFSVTFGAAFNMDHFMTRPFRFHSVSHSWNLGS